MPHIMFCQKCRDNNNPPWYGYMSCSFESKNCPLCGGELKKINFNPNDLDFFRDKVSKDINFLESMIKLSQENPIEYQMKLSQFKAQLGQQESSRVQNDNRPKCPHCNSTNISKISTTERVGSIAMWGIFSKKINKSFKCKSCGYTW